MSTNAARDEIRHSRLQNAIRQEVARGARLDAQENYRARLIYGNEPLNSTTMAVGVVIGLFLWPVYIYLAYRWVKSADSQLITLSVDMQGNLHRVPPQNKPMPPSGATSPEKRKRIRIVWGIFIAILLIAVISVL